MNRSWRPSSRGRRHPVATPGVDISRWYWATPRRNDVLHLPFPTLVIGQDISEAFAGRKRRMRRVEVGYPAAIGFGFRRIVADGFQGSIPKPRRRRVVLHDKTSFGQVGFWLGLEVRTKDYRSKAVGPEGSPKRICIFPGLIEEKVVQVRLLFPDGDRVEEGHATPGRLLTCERWKLGSRASTQSRSSLKLAPARSRKSSTSSRSWRRVRETMGWLLADARDGLGLTRLGSKTTRTGWPPRVIVNSLVSNHVAVGLRHLEYMFAGGQDLAPAGVPA